ncbi:MAG: pantoate--beta-alanine ligase, partial [Aeromicrobium sp.]
LARASDGADAVLGAAHKVIDGAPGIDLDYLVLTNADLGEPVPGHEARLLIEGRVGTTRLIDNTGLTLGR